RRIGLLHDIGKAISCKEGLTHASAGANAALEWGESEEVANGIACHHHEVGAKTLEAALCKPADHLSASLLGTRHENSDHFYKRLQSFEEIAKQFTGVESAFALQAGKQLMVYVKPDLVGDAQVAQLARAITKKIEETGKKVQVTVIRQTSSYFVGRSFE
ncbi:MAG: HDIG domain-containing protein, partial [Verrucomicrobia bacterium]|nr:HDIG domain-containing protein [Verrucomicrobiota bacterium]